MVRSNRWLNLTVMRGGEDTKFQRSVTFSVTVNVTVNKTLREIKRIQWQQSSK